MQRAGRQLDVVEMPIGGVALDAGDEALPERTRLAAQQADAVLLGAVGLPKYDGQPGNRRPEKGLLDLRKALGVYANLRPVRAVPALASLSPLKAELLDGVDLIVVRELLGDVYFGEPRGIDGDRAYNTMVYTRDEVRARRQAGVRAGAPPQEPRVLDRQGQRARGVAAVAPHGERAAQRELLGRQARAPVRRFGGHGPR